MKLKSIILLVVFVNLINVYAQENLIAIPQIIEISTATATSQEETLILKSQEDTKLNLELSQNLKDFITINDTIYLKADQQEKINLSINIPFNKIPQIYVGQLKIKNKDFEKIIDIILNLKPQKQLLDLTLDLSIKRLKSTDQLNGKLEIVNLGNFKPLKLNINYIIKNINNEIIHKSSEIKVIDKQVNIPISIPLKQLNKGTNFLEVEVSSDFSTERTLSSFTILDTPTIEEAVTKFDFITNALIVFSIIILIILFYLIINKSKNLKKSLILILIILIILVGIFYLFNYNKKPTEQPKYSASPETINITKAIGISELTNEPFLKKATDSLIIYIAKTSKIITPEIKINSSNGDILISLGDTILKVSKQGRKYNFDISSKSKGLITCNYLCIWNFTLWTEIIGIILIIILIIIINKHIKKRIPKPKIEELDIKDLILKIESFLLKDPFNAIRSFFVCLLDLNYEATLEEIKHEINKSNLNNEIKNKISSLLDKLNKYHYAHEDIKREIIKDFNIVLHEFQEKSYKQQDLIKKDAN